MSECEHSDKVYSYCLACELAKREKLCIDMIADCNRWKALAKRAKGALESIRDYNEETSWAGRCGHHEGVANNTLAAWPKE